MAKRKKRLNILNSQKIFNLTIRKPTELVEITIDTYLPFYESIQGFIDDQDEFVPTRDGTNYRLWYDSDMDYNFLLSMVEYAGSVEFVTNSPLPVSLIDKMAKYPKNCFLTYQYKTEYNNKDIANIQQASAGVKISILLTADEQTSTYEILSSLADLAFITDELVITYLGSNLDEEYNFFSEIRDALSGWKIAIIFETDSQTEEEYMLDRKEVDERMKKSSTVWTKQ